MIATLSGTSSCAALQPARSASATRSEAATSPSGHVLDGGHLAVGEGEGPVGADDVAAVPLAHLVLLEAALAQQPQVVGGHGHARLLGQLAHRGGLPALAGGHDPAEAEVPARRPHVLPVGPLVDEDLRAGADDDADAAVAEVAGAHLVARHDAHHRPACVDHLDLLVRGASHRSPR